MVKNCLWQEYWVIVELHLFSKYWALDRCQACWRHGTCGREDVLPSQSLHSLLRSSCRRQAMNSESHRIMMQRTVQIIIWRTKTRYYDRNGMRLGDYVSLRMKVGLPEKRHLSWNLNKMPAMQSFCRLESR